MAPPLAPEGDDRGDRDEEGGDAIVPKVDGKFSLGPCDEENSGHLAWYRDVNNGDAKLMMCTPDGFGWWTLV